MNSCDLTVRRSRKKVEIFIKKWRGKMKSIKLIGAMLLVMLAVSASVWCQESSLKRDNFGKIIGRIFDKETNLPVNEIFKVFLADCVDVSHPKSTNVNFVKSSSRGVFVFNNVEPGIYCVEFSPLAEKTIYCHEPAPKFSPEFQHIVKIQSGQITRMVHKARHGGNLRVVLVDKGGNKIIPRSIMQPSPDPLFSDADLNKLNVQIDSEEYPEDRVTSFIGYNTADDDRLDDGEFTVFGLFPGKYRIDADLTFLGYGCPIEVNHIDVIEGKTAETRVLLDLVDDTGIEGTIVDQYGNPVKSATVGVVFQTDDKNLKFSASIRTNQNGYYKIIGLKEGLYELDIFIVWDWENYTPGHKIFGNVKITKNALIQKNLTIEKPNK